VIYHAHYISLFYFIRPTSENWLLHYWSWPLSDPMGNKIHGADVSITNAFDHFFWPTVFYCSIVFYLFIYLFFHIQLYPYYHHYNIIVIILLFRLRVKRTSTHVRVLLRRAAHASIRVWWQTMMMIIIILRFW